MMKRIAAALAASGALALSACGGGGSGSDTPTLSLTSVQPSSVHFDIYEGEPVPDLQISGSVGGDLTQLSGKTLYIIAAIPDPLFSTTPLFSLGADKHSGTLFLSGVYPPAAVATYANDITVLACLDSGCTNQLAGSGFKVPYVVNVRSGLKSATTALTTSLSVRFRHR